MNTWNVFNSDGKIVGQLHGITRGYGQAVMFVKYRGDARKAEGVTFHGTWPSGTFEVAPAGDKDREAFAQRKLRYFREQPSAS